MTSLFSTIILLTFPFSVPQSRTSSVKLDSYLIWLCIVSVCLLRFLIGVGCWKRKQIKRCCRKESSESCKCSFIAPHLVNAQVSLKRYLKVYMKFKFRPQFYSQCWKCILGEKDHHLQFVYILSFSKVKRVGSCQNQGVTWQESQTVIIDQNCDVILFAWQLGEYSNKL